MATGDPERLDSIESVIADFRDGRLVILMDDEDRENEGDLLVAASTVRAEDINFMARFGRGLVCLALTRDRCERLKLPLMVSDNNARYSTNFTVSIEAARGVTTGISAGDRATTVRAAVAPDAGAGDLVQPGHIFPLMAQPGGVLSRAGHTEAAVDLARLAGLEPAGVICEILNEDGSMARMPDLVKYAREHGLKIGTIADLIRYRLQHEKTIECVARSPFHSRYGEFELCAFRDLVDGRNHLALVAGEIVADRPTLVRVHVQTGLFERVAETAKDYAWSIAASLERIAAEGCGVVVLLDCPQYGEDLGARVRHSQMADLGIEFPWRHASEELRTIGAGARILADLGVGRMRVLGKSRKVHSLSGFGLEIVDYVPEP